MSIQISTQVWSLCQQRGERRLLMLALAEFANDEGFCWPSQASLAKRIFCTERGVQKMIDCLLRDGEMELMKAGGGRGRSAEYRLSRYVKGEQHSPIQGVKGELETPFKESQKGEHENTKGEPRDTKGEQAVPPNRQEPSNRTVTRTVKVAVELPANLKTPEFQKAFSEYAEYRREQRYKALGDKGTKALLAQCSEWGPDSAVSAINHSMAKGWQGVFQPDRKNGHTVTGGIDKSRTIPLTQAEMPPIWYPEDHLND